MRGVARAVEALEEFTPIYDSHTAQTASQGRRSVPTGNFSAMCRSASRPAASTVKCALLFQPQLHSMANSASGLASGGPASPHELPGLIDMVGRQTLAGMMPKFAAAPLDFQPGSRWAYSPLAGFDTLGRVVEVASGMSLDQFLRQRMFTPLGMKTTAFHPGDDRWSSVVTAYHRVDGVLTSPFLGAGRGGEKTLDARPTRGMLSPGYAGKKISATKASRVVGVVFAGERGSSICQTPEAATINVVRVTPSALIPSGTNIAALDFGGEIESVTGSYGPGHNGRLLIDGLPEPTWRPEGENPLHPADPASDHVKFPQEIVLSFYASSEEYVGKVYASNCGGRLARAVGDDDAGQWILRHCLFVASRFPSQFDSSRPPTILHHHVGQPPIA